MTYSKEAYSAPRHALKLMVGSAAAIIAIMLATPAEARDHNRGWGQGGGRNGGYEHGGYSESYGRGYGNQWQRPCPPRWSHHRPHVNYYASPVYYAPPPVYYRPQPVYYAPPVYGPSYSSVSFSYSR